MVLLKHNGSGSTIIDNDRLGRSRHSSERGTRYSQEMCGGYDNGGNYNLLERPSACTSTNQNRHVR